MANENKAFRWQTKNEIEHPIRNYKGIRETTLLLKAPFSSKVL